MRIALVSQEYPPETARGGIGTQTYAKAHGLAGLGHEVHVVSHSPDGDVHRYRDGAVEVTRVPGCDDVLAIHAEAVRWLTYSTRVAAAVAALHAEAPFDLVDFPEYGAEGYVHLLNRVPWQHVPTVVHLHGPVVMLAHTLGWPDPGSEFFRAATAMEGACVRLADAVFSSSRCSALWCARHYGLDADAVPVLHTGVDAGLFRPDGRPAAERPTIVFVGRIAESKGVELLLEAACRLAGTFPGLHLRLLGAGEARLLRRLREQAAAAGLPELLDLPGYVPREALPGHLARAHVFAAPSRYEGGPGFVYLEAMACGLPVVACAGSGAAEVVRDGETGVLVPPGDVDALAAALAGLLHDAGRRAAMGAHARRQVEEEADGRVCLQRLERFYERIAAHIPRPTTYA